MNRPIAVLALDDRPSLRARLEDAFEVRQTTPSVRALALALWSARRASPTGLILAVVPASRPELTIVASALGADRVVVAHVAHRRDALAGSTLRAAYARVDWTYVENQTDEHDAVMAGADPDRVLDAESPLEDRILLEPPRAPGARGLVEIAASLALDAAELSGAVRLIELLTPNRGVNVVNYHRVLPLSELLGYIRPEMAIGEPVFAAQLELIMSRRGFTRVDRVRDPDSSGRVAITFDDGYEDNYRVAMPVLQRFSAPACIFVVTNLIGRPEALWWDRLGLGLFAYWRAGCPFPLPPEVPARARRLAETRAFGEARAIISAVISDLNLEPEPHRAAALERLEALLPDLGPKRTMLTWDEVAAMARAGIMFGAHTQNHVPLDELPPELARKELFGSQEELDQRVNGHPRMAALPRGRLGPVTEEEMRREGFQAIMTTEPGVNRVDEDSLFVRRRDGRMLMLHGRHHPAKLRLELTGLVDRLRGRLARVSDRSRR